MLDLLWLLLPVAAASGWITAKYSQNTNPKTSSKNCSPEYYQGLNYLLNEQPDKAIEVFTKMLEVDNETVETHLALGNLFRRRGEVDRAIRIHQNLIARPTLTYQQRYQALLELGQDYMRAGLLDRAENLFQDITDIKPYNIQALQHLVNIYEQEKDWEKAIESKRKLDHITQKSSNKIIAQYYCELAEQAFYRRDEARATQYLKQATLDDPNCVRATILLGNIKKQHNDYKTAIDIYQKIERQDIRFLSEVLPPLKQCYEKIGQPQLFQNYLQRILSNQKNEASMLAMAELIQTQSNEKEAGQFIIQHLKTQPSLYGLDRLITLGITQVDGSTKEVLLVLKDLIHKILQQQAHYRCGYCGFGLKNLYWQCPRCHTWNSIRAIEGIEPPPSL